jgi:hypothetical protein
MPVGTVRILSLLAMASEISSAEGVGGPINLPILGHR